MAQYRVYAFYAPGEWQRSFPMNYADAQTLGRKWSARLRNVEIVAVGSVREQVLEAMGECEDDDPNRQECCGAIKPDHKFSCGNGGKKQLVMPAKVVKQ